MIFMAIQIPNPGTGNGQTGDNEFVLWSKVKGNFENSTHAASRLVGSAKDTIPTNGTFGILDSGFAGKAPVITFANMGEFRSQIGNTSRLFTTNMSGALIGRYSPCLFIKSNDVNAAISIGTANQGVTASAWNDALTDVNDYVLYTDKSRVIYSTTTAAGANVVVDTNGKLMRSTSSERYKDILGNLELDDKAYKNAMQLAPIVYRSTANADNPDYHYYSFSAEKLGAFDPAFTLWRETETVTDDEGNTIEQPLTERVAEGININALLAFSHAIAIKQDKMIKAQAEAIETLTKRIDAMAVK